LRQVTKFDWILGRAQLITAFLGRYRCFHFSLPIFYNTQTTVERQYISPMKKRVTWNFVQTWVTKIR